MLPDIFTVLLSFLPCVLWLIYFHRQDRYDPEPFQTIFITFLLGVISTFGAYLGNSIGLGMLQLGSGQTVLTETLGFFLVVGPVEEGVKFLSVYVYAYRRPEFDEPVDGVVYSAAAALGFAAAENVLYVVEHGTSVLLVRGLLSNLGHAVFAAFWGLAMSRSKAMPNIPYKRIRVLLGGWLLASLFHGLFDSILNLGQIFGFVALPLLGLMVGLFSYLKSRINWFLERSPHKEGTRLLSQLIPCAACGMPGIGGQFCQSCGVQITSAEEIRTCSACHAKQRPGASFCNKCGASLLVLSGKQSAVIAPHFISIDATGSEAIAHVVDQDGVNIGKTLDNQFVVDDPSVSKRHARVEQKSGGECLLIDLGSVNGTFVNGKRIVKGVLRNGCEVRFGSVSYIFRQEVTPLRELAAAPVRPSGGTAASEDARRREGDKLTG